jgi:hypothetical protein
MARETRFSRRLIGSAVREFVEQAKAGKVRSRIITWSSRIIYVFVCYMLGEDYRMPIAELGNRGFVARHLVGGGDLVVGVGLGHYVSGVGSTSDLMCMNLSNWSGDDDDTARKMIIDLGYFSEANSRHSHENEYPVW